MSEASSRRAWQTPPSFTRNNARPARDNLADWCGWALNTPALQPSAVGPLLAYDSARREATEVYSELKR